MRSLTVLVTVSTSLLFNLGANAQTPAPDPQRIRVALYEVSSDDWGIGGVPVSVLRPNG